ncbi:RIM1 [Candida oxycetoniae]|uniref:RIM1 n=1 Tax=Candida oxycetoniae TaxID=497107 RepID=A0AAI9X040_9ASCO|nr:RIM1 [Candida oxycetoniae]KAI3407027.1 RIM1 [Candida oxycetoniae]
MLKSFARTFSSTIAKRDFARTQLLGRVGFVEFKESPNGTRYVMYSLAVNKKFDGKEETDWYKIFILGEEQVAAAERALRVGNKMFVDAKLTVKVVDDVSRYSLVQKKMDIIQWGKKSEDEHGESEHAENETQEK